MKADTAMPEVARHRLPFVKSAARASTKTKWRRPRAKIALPARIMPMIIPSLEIMPTAQFVPRANTKTKSLRQLRHRARIASKAISVLT